MVGGEVSVGVGGAEVGVCSADDCSVGVATRAPALVLTADRVAGAVFLAVDAGCTVLADDRDDGLADADGLVLFERVGSCSGDFSITGRSSNALPPSSSINLDWPATRVCA